MPGLVGQAGRVKLSPLQQAVAAQQSTPSGSQAGGSVSPSVAASTGLRKPNVNIPANQTDVAAALQAAQGGDKQAMQWLADMGIVAGAAVGSIALGTAASRMPKLPPTPVGPQPGDLIAEQYNGEFPKFTPEPHIPVEAPKVGNALQDAMRVIRRIK